MTLTTLSQTGIRTLSRTSYSTNPHTIPPSAPLINPSYQYRTLWYSCHEDESRPRQRRARILYQHHHHPRCRHPRLAQKGQEGSNEGDPWEFKRRWAANTFKAFPAEDWSPDRQWNDLWNSQSTRARRRMERIKKEIDADPYAAVFGRRHEPLDFPRLEETFTTLWNSFLGLGSGFVKEGKSKNSSSTASPGDDAAKKSDRISYDPSDPVLYLNAKPRSPSGVSARGDGLEFDPISGRMVQKAPKLVEEDAEHKPTDSNRDRLATYNFLKEYQKRSGRLNAGTSEIETTASDSTQKAPANISMPPEVSPGLSASEIRSLAADFSSPKTLDSAANSKDVESPHGQASSVAATQTGLDSMATFPEVTSDAIRAVPPRTEDQTEAPAPTSDVESHITPQSMGPESWSLDVSDVTNSEPLVEHKGQEQALDRVGFLSRRGEESPVPAPEIIQEQYLIHEEDSNLDLLRANDIRAVYEPRRSSIKSEVEAEEAEADKGFNWHSASNATFFTSPTPHAEPPTEHSKSMSVPPEKSTPVDSIQVAERTPEGLFQNEKPAAEASGSTESSPAEVYRIFVYDPSSIRVTEAETLSSLQPSTEHLHPAEVLTSLANPAKFLPCLNKMRAEGYEIVSGGEDILVFRKALSTPKQNVQGQESAAETVGSESIDTAPEQPTATGFYTGNRLSRAGESHQEKQRSRTSTALRRMLISGAATAGTFYAIGVVVEYFRTGGVDGWGVDGFTVFESERRHRDA
ncbi:hypothetical protein BJY01DRAFT_34462 [Aspergillus pseudoustus]|uniref:Serine-threonine rich protein n=1 Tax=Aspergillus pseudoustus TaxID=1810923 RepID=A0ABR4JE91_9EURO